MVDRPEGRLRPCSRNIQWWLSPVTREADISLEGMSAASSGSALRALAGRSRNASTGAEPSSPSRSHASSEAAGDHGQEWQGENQAVEALFVGYP